MESADILTYNRDAWDRQARERCEWSRPVEPEVIARARRGDWEVMLTPNRPVPREWFPPLQGCDLLCLASAGGQQAPVLAAAGANVVSFDNSPEQLALDRLVAEREGLTLRTIQGDMADLSSLGDASFDCIFHAVSNVFVPDVRPVWRECRRVLRRGGVLLAGFMNPAFFLFDHDQAEATGELRARFPLPYAEPGSLDEAGRQALLKSGRALEFSHSLTSQIGGQMEAGLSLTALFEDDWSPEATPLDRFMPCFIATRAVAS